MKRMITCVLAAVLLAALIAIPSFAADSSLLFHFKMDNGDFGKDECGNAVTTVFGEIESAEGKVGDAALFDGFESCIFVESDVPNHAAVTFTTWMYTDFFDHLSLAISRWDKMGDFCFAVDPDTHMGNNQYPSSDVAAWHFSQNALNASEWYYCTYVFDTENLYTEVYINGELDSRQEYESADAMGNFVNFNQFTIGGFFYGTSPEEGGTPQRVLPGAMDDFRVYGRALSQDEIKQLMTTGEIAPFEAPVEEAPVEEAPVEEAPVEEAPVEEAPVEEAPVEEAPVEEVVEAAPVAAAPQTFDLSVLLLACVGLFGGLTAVAFRRKND